MTAVRAAPGMTAARQVYLERGCRDAVATKDSHQKMFLALRCGARGIRG